MRRGIELGGRFWHATHPHAMSPGKAEGPVAMAHEGNLTARDGRWIFACPSTQRSLRSLIPFARGFVFEKGQWLGHVGALLRRERIPACIDRELFALLQEAAHSAAPIQCRLLLGEAASRDKGSWQAKVEMFQQRLLAPRRSMPILGLAGTMAADEPTVVLGEKALGVNALLARGFCVPPALAIVNFGAGGAFPAKGSTLATQIGRAFPRFGDGVFTLMVRGSPPAAQAAPGLLRSVAVTSWNELEQAAAGLAARWSDYGNSSTTGLTLLLQEHIPAVARGILCTRTPWDPNGPPVAELTFDGEAGKVVLLIEDVPAFVASGGDALSLPAKIEPGIVRQEFGHLVDQALVMQGALGSPVEIEFVLTRELMGRPVQLRPCLVV